MKWIPPIAGLAACMFLSRADAAGPETTARLLAAADALSARPLAERVLAYRTVLRARKRYDVNAFRALRRLARLFDERRDTHARSALATCSAVRHPKHERGTYLAHIRLARGLRTDGDLEAARDVFRSVVARGRRVAPKAVAQALVYLAEDAFDRGDEPTVRWALTRADEARADPVTRMRVAGWLGLLALQRGDRKAALKLQLRCWKLYDGTQKADPKLARKAAKTWLDLPLRHALRE